MIRVATDAEKAAKRLSKPQCLVLLSLFADRPRLLNHRESVSVLVMERLAIGECIFAQLTTHGYARGQTIYDTQAHGQLTKLGEKVQAIVRAQSQAVSPTPLRLGARAGR